jgi:hypothetical protein
VQAWAIVRPLASWSHEACTVQPVPAYMFLIGLGEAFGAMVISRLLSSRSDGLDSGAVSERSGCSKGDKERKAEAEATRAVARSWKAMPGWEAGGESVHLDATRPC